MKNFSGGVYSLPVIKPNLVAKGDHFLYTFLATALKADRERNAKNDPHSNDSPILSRLQHSFQDVSGYLQVINDEARLQENDPLGMSLERLERHESGLILIDKMSEFIKELADLYKGCDLPSVVLMPVDDADISQEVLVNVLQTCWSFLKHPRLVPVFTFTGRLAEELLRVEFDRELTTKEQDKGGKRDRPRETYTSLSVSENMAIQYLGRLFPVRNRIRLRPISARVLAAEYEATMNGEKQKVKSLLETASMILFGHSRVPIASSIKPPLSMVTLRRQIQIVDAMHAMGIQPMDFETLIKKLVEPDSGNNSNNKESPRTWGQTFDMATWSLLNAHRDVLKETKIELDDLYSWTPRGLRQVVLDCILGLDQERRLKLIKHWRYSTEDRRSQIISLLAANVFRPRMEGEEPTGDEPDEIESWLEQRKNKKEKVYEMEKMGFTFPISQGIIWFLNLFIGFYLPQILACSRLDSKSRKEGGTGSITGIGWDLTSGPIHAIREALKNKKIFSTGMLFLNPAKFEKIIKKQKPPVAANLKVFIYLWCFYGFKKGRAWAAVSLWRGLGLLGKILQVEFDLIKRKVNKKRRIIHIKTILWEHLDSALVLGDLPKGPVFVETESGRKEISFDFEKLKDTGAIKGVIENLAEKLIDWHDQFRFNQPEKQEEKGRSGELNQSTPYMVFPMDPLGISKLDLFKSSAGIGEDKVDKKLTNSDRKNLTEYYEEHAWEACFTRRLHGENLMCIFWQNLENAYYQKKLSKWNLMEILKAWCTVLGDYWKGCGVKISLNTKESENSKSEEKNEFIWNPEKSKINELIKSCPIFYENFKDEILVMRQEEEEVKVVKKEVEKMDTEEGKTFLKSLEKLQVEPIDESSFFIDENETDSGEKPGQTREPIKEKDKQMEYMKGEESISGD
jgi:predicted transcriptional regulator